MKKFVTFITAAVICAAAAPLFACSDGDGRTEYDITCQYFADSGTLSAVCTVNYKNDGAATDALKFNLYGNAYREGALYRPVSEELTSDAYYSGESYGNMEITEVTGGQWRVCGEDENILEITLPETLAAGGRCEVTISYTLTLAKINHRTGITERTVNLGNFYPVACARDGNGEFIECVYYSDGDPFLSECADYDVQITVPASYTVAASGQLKESNANVYAYSLENARDFALVLSDEFNSISREVGGTQVTYYYYEDGNAQAKLAAAGDSLAYFESVFGEYIYPTYSVVQTGFAAGGMEYPGLAMINGELGESDAVYAAVHETAHQWWYAMVGSDQINCAWQDEGLAEYSALLFFENSPEYGVTRTGLVNSALAAYRAYFTVYNQIFGDADTAMTRHLKDFVSDYEYVNIAYNKGLIMFDTLRESIGDEKFFAGLKNYYADCLGKTASPEELIACFKGTGVDVDGFFTSFLKGKIVI